MTPTQKLRWIERTETFITEPYGVNTGRKTRTLQQWWAIERNGQITPEGEWRDVPVEKEA